MRIREKSCVFSLLIECLLKFPIVFHWFGEYGEECGEDGAAVGAGEEGGSGGSGVRIRRSNLFPVRLKNTTN